MGRYILKRLALFIPTLLVISVILFFISKLSSGDAVSNQLEITSEKANFNEIIDQWAELSQKRRQLGLDKPYFYFSLNRRSSSDTIDLIPDLKVRKSLENIAFKCGNWEKTNQYYAEIKSLLKNKNVSDLDKRTLLALVRVDNLDEANKLINNINSSYSDALSQSFDELTLKPSHLNNYLLAFNWHGIDNQYHVWISSLVTGNLGHSHLDGASINQKVAQAIYWTVILSFISLFLSFAIGISAGIYAAHHKDSRIDRFLNMLFYAFYSLPNFWVATLLILFLAGGDFLYLFPSYGLGEIHESMNWLEIILTRISHLFLPILCLSYGSIAFIFRQVRGSMLKQLNSNYVQTAKAKGISDRNILLKHAFKNATFPLITLIGGVLPSIISGSFVVEHIFSIPGMGKLSIEAFLSRDYPLIFGVLMMAAVIGMLGILIADILYYSNDPRISFSTNNNRK